MRVKYFLRACFRWLILRWIICIFQSRFVYVWAWSVSQALFIYLFLDFLLAGITINCITISSTMSRHKCLPTVSMLNEWSNCANLKASSPISVFFCSDQWPDTWIHIQQVTVNSVLCLMISPAYGSLTFHSLHVRSCSCVTQVSGLKWQTTAQNCLDCLALSCHHIMWRRVIIELHHCTLLQHSSYQHHTPWVLGPGGRESSGFLRCIFRCKLVVNA